MMCYNLCQKNFLHNCFTCFYKIRHAFWFVLKAQTGRTPTLCSSLASSAAEEGSDSRKLHPAPSDSFPPVFIHSLLEVKLWAKVSPGSAADIRTIRLKIQNQLTSGAGEDEPQRAEQFWFRAAFRRKTSFGVDAGKLVKCTYKTNSSLSFNTSKAVKVPGLGSGSGGGLVFCCRCFFHFSHSNQGVKSKQRCIQVNFTLM